MDEKTKALVDAAEKRAEAATPGEWQFQTNTLPPTQGVVLRAHYVLAVDAEHQVIAGSPANVFFPEDDARFIAAARSDVPALCAAVREQAAEIERLHGAQALLGTSLQRADATIKRLLARIRTLEEARDELTSDPPLRTSSHRECARCCKPRLDAIVGLPNRAYCMCG